MCFTCHPINRCSSQPFCVGVSLSVSLCLILRPAAGPLFVHPSSRFVTRDVDETMPRPPCNATLLPLASLSLQRPPTPYPAVAVSPS